MAADAGASAPRPVAVVTGAVLVSGVAALTAVVVTLLLRR
jgi:hypothetical protein